MQAKKRDPASQVPLSGSKADVRIEAGGMTDVGRVRSANEDAYVIAGLQRSIIVHDSSPAARGWFAGASAGTLLIVADGMGGQGGGDVASQVAVNTVVNHLLNCMPWAVVSMTAPNAHSPSLPDVREQLSVALVAGDQTVKSTGARTGTPHMGTTLTMALVLWPVLYVAHVGDTRCYLFRAGKLKRLTTDHTMAQQLSEISAEAIDPASHLHHILWNALGASEDLPKPEITKLELELGDVLLLCSDGLNKHVTDTQIVTVLTEGLSSAARSAKLVELANAAGGSDNVTAIVAEAVHLAHKAL